MIIDLYFVYVYIYIFFFFLKTIHGHPWLYNIISINYHQIVF